MKIAHLCTLVAWAAAASLGRAEIGQVEYHYHEPPQFTDAAIAVDGLVEPAWAKAPAHPLELVISGYGNPTDAADLSATWKAMYDGRNLFVLIEVTDNAVVENGGTPGEGWTNDSVMIFLDPDKSAHLPEGQGGSNPAEYDFLNDYGFFIQPAGSVFGSTPNSASPAMEGIGYAATLTEHGYVVEFSIVWLRLLGESFIATEDYEFGFDVAVYDRDSAGAGETMKALQWGSDSAANRQAAGEFGLVRLHATPPFVASLPRVPGAGAGEAAIDIDGLPDLAWRSAPDQPIAHRVFEKDLTPGEVTPENFQPFVRMMWDDVNLYLLFSVKDDIIVDDLGASWVTDGVEVFIDSKNQGDYLGAITWHNYPPLGDYQFGFRAHDVAAVSIGAASAGAGAGIPFVDGVIYDLSEWRSADKKTVIGYYMEIGIAWATLLGNDFVPSKGYRIGLEVGVNDDDITDVGALPPEKAWQWGTNYRNSWRSPSGFPELVLDGTAQAITFPALPAKTYGAANFAAGATTTSGLPITLTSSDPKVAQIAGSTIQVVGAGQATITATQDGNATFAPALPVSHILNVAPLPATLTIGSLAQIADGLPKPVTVTTNPIGLPWTATYDGLTDPPKNAGRYAVVVQIADPNYEGSGAAELVITEPYNPFALLMADPYGSKATFLGALWDTWYPWIIGEQGWWYVSAQESEAGFWLFDLSIDTTGGWLYVAPAFHPFFYSVTSAQWYAYGGVADQQRYFFDNHLPGWVTFPLSE